MFGIKMPLQRNQRQDYRRSRSRSPYRRHQSSRRSRSPRAAPKRTGRSFSPRDRKPITTFKERGRAVSPRRRSPIPSKPKDSKPVLSLSEEKASGRYMKDTRHVEQRHLPTRRSISKSPLRDKSFGSAHMDRVHTETKMETRIVRKKMTLTDRFGIDQRKFKLEENITIGLQRNPNVPISTVVNVKNKDFDFDKFVLKRRLDEGSKPIFDREEIKVFHHDDNLDEQDDFERRVITILPTKTSDRGRSRDADVDLSVRRSLSTNVTFDDRQWVKNARETQHSSSVSNRRERDERSSYREEKLQITRMRTPSPRREPQIRLDPKPDPRYEAKFRANRERDEGSLHKKMERIETITQNPNDLRHSLLHRRISNPAEDARYKIEAKRQEENDSKPRHGRDAWQVANEHHRDRNKPQSSGRSQSGSAQRRSSGDLRNILPDFKNREDKFKYEEWKDKPEMVPKGITYYEHDNRGEDNGSFQRPGQGRPVPASFSYRSRSDGRRFPSSRGGYRPKPYSQSQQRSQDRLSSRPSSRPSTRPSTRPSSRPSFGSSRDSFRSRGSSRFSGGFGSRGRSSSERGEWKHDMYAKLEKEDDNCPTSTT